MRRDDVLRSMHSLLESACEILESVPRGVCPTVDPFIEKAYEALDEAMIEMKTIIALSEELGGNAFVCRETAYDRYLPDLGNFNDFPVGTRVRVKSRLVDFYFFNGETGEVVRNDHRYLGIIVRFDEPRIFEDGCVQEEFNFNPKDLEIIT